MDGWILGVETSLEMVMMMVIVIIIILLLLLFLVVVTSLEQGYVRFIAIQAKVEFVS